MDWRLLEMFYKLLDSQFFRGKHSLKIDYKAGKSLSYETAEKQKPIPIPILNNQWIKNE